MSDTTMLSMIDQEIEIERAENILIDKIRFEPGMRKVHTRVGYQGGGEKIDVYWSDHHNFWFAFRKLENRFWNAFGLDEPNEKSDLSITCEINFPLKGIDRRIAGALARDQNGQLTVIHRGKIGGGRKGVSKTLFQENYQYPDRWEKVCDGNRDSRVVVIGSLASTDFIIRIAEFVYEVARIKSNSNQTKENRKSGGGSYVA